MMHYIIFSKSWSILYQFILSIILREIHLFKQKEKETIRLWAERNARVCLLYLYHLY